MGFLQKGNKENVSTENTHPLILLAKACIAYFSFYIGNKILKVKINKIQNECLCALAIVQIYLV